MAPIDERQLRAVIFYEWRRGSNASAAAANINDAFEDAIVSRWTVNRWFNRFAAGDTSLDDKERPGRPSSVNEDELLRGVKENPGATTRELATTVGCSQQSIVSHLHDLGYRKVLARWIPHRLTDANRLCRMSICQSLLLRPHKREFLEDLVTGDESWILYENDTRHAVWLPRGEEPPTQPKPDTRSRKVMLCVWWDSKGALYFELLPTGSTITALTYADQLQKLADAIREKRPRRSSVHLLHDNARPHIASATKKKLAELGWQTVPHPPYSPDLAPSDYHLFRPLKHFLQGKTFANYDDLKTAITDFFALQPLEFWTKGIEELPNRWVKVIDSDGDYIID